MSSMSRFFWHLYIAIIIEGLPALVAQSVASPTTDPGVASSIPVGFNTFVEIYHEISSTVILLLPLIQEGWLTGT